MINLQCLFVELVLETFFVPRRKQVYFLCTSGHFSYRDVKFPWGPSGSLAPHSGEPVMCEGH